MSTPRAVAVRTALLVGGLALYGTSMAMMISGGLGLNPWDVFHQGVGSRLPISFGAVTALTGAMVLLLWIPLRQRPGIGTVANVVVIALSVDLALGWMPHDASLPARTSLLLGGVVLNGVATAAYISAGLGPGPRDGLMTGLVARTGLSVRVVRTSLEVTVVATGWLLGGTVGAGTVVYALAIGPLVQMFLAIMPSAYTTRAAAVHSTHASAGVQARGHSSVGGTSSGAVNSVPAERIPTDTP